MEREILKFGWKAMKNKEINKVLTRKTIDAYRKGSESERKDIEHEFSDSFEQDALHGWYETGASMAVMSKMDKQFSQKPTFFSKKVIGGMTGFAVLIGFFFAYQAGKNQNIPTDNDKLLAVTVDKTDVQLPVKIDTMQLLPTSEQLIPIPKKNDKLNTNKTDNASINSEKPTTKVYVPVEIPSITLEPLPSTIIHKEVSVSKQKTAKEIFIQDFKTVDYRSYREKPSIQIEQIILTGTPANLEGEASETVTTESRTVQIPYMDYLDKTMYMVNRGKWKQALQRFQEILISYPDDLNARFYAGFCYYNLKQYTDACTSFSACLQLEFSNFNEEATWYLAQSRLAKGDKAGAKELFISIRDQKAYYAKQAEKILKSL